MWFFILGLDPWNFPFSINIAIDIAAVHLAYALISRSHHFTTDFFLVLCLLTLFPTLPLMSPELWRQYLLYRWICWGWESVNLFIVFSCGSLWRLQVAVKRGFFGEEWLIYLPVGIRMRLRMLLMDYAGSEKWW